jgi:hypothetical protein
MFFNGVEFLTHLSSIRRGIIWKLGDDETKVIEFLKLASGEGGGTGGGDRLSILRIFALSPGLPYGF